jgi:hypothetical protein
MGMYDSIQVKKDLEIPEEVKNLYDWKNHNFQTKDLDNCLSEYIINEYNELVEVIIDRKYIPYTEEERKNPDIKPWNLWKDVIEGEKTYNVLNYHGTINFYTYESIDDDTDFWLDYKAYFIYGKLDKIEFLEFKKDSGRKSNNKKFFQELEKEKKTFWYKFKKIANFLGWKWFWKNVDWSIYKLSNFLNYIRTFIIRNLF